MAIGAIVEAAGRLTRAVERVTCSIRKTISASRRHAFRRDALTHLTSGRAVGWRGILPLLAHVYLSESA